MLRTPSVDLRYAFRFSSKSFRKVVEKLYFHIFQSCNKIAETLTAGGDPSGPHTHCLRRRPAPFPLATRPCRPCPLAGDDEFERFLEHERQELDLGEDPEPVL